MSLVKKISVIVLFYLKVITSVLGIFLIYNDPNHWVNYLLFGWFAFTAPTYWALQIQYLGIWLPFYEGGTVSYKNETLAAKNMKACFTTPAMAVTFLFAHHLVTAILIAVAVYLGISFLLKIIKGKPVEMSYHFYKS